MHKPQIEEQTGNANASSVSALTGEMIAEPAVWMCTALHDLAQPLTALECVLFLSTLEPQPDVKQLRQAIDDALAQCRRMTVGVRAMQDRLHDCR